MTQNPKTSQRSLRGVHGHAGTDVHTAGESSSEF